MKLIFIAGIILALSGLLLAAPCDEPINPQSCPSKLTSFAYFDKVKVCGVPLFTGCPGSTNRFKTKEECEATCKK